MKHSSASKGFTLIELLIAIGIFSIFIVIITGVFSRFVEVERHSIAQGALILDVQSAVESFIKEARTGYGSTYWTLDGKQVAFRNQSGVCVGYRVNTAGVFERAEDPGSEGSAECTNGSFQGVPFTALTGNGTKISEIFFDTTPSEFDQTTFVLENQGVITLSLTATPTKSKILPIRIQNTVTSRQTKAYDN